MARVVYKYRACTSINIVNPDDPYLFIDWPLIGATTIDAYALNFCHTDAYLGGELGLPGVGDALLHRIRERIHVGGINALFRIEKCGDCHRTGMRVRRGDHYRRRVNTGASLNSFTHSFDEVSRQSQEVHTDQSDNGFFVCQHECTCEQIIVDSLRHALPGGEAGQWRTYRRGYTDFAESCG